MKYYSEFIYYLPAHSLILLLIGLVFVSGGVYCSLKTQKKAIVYACLFIGFMLIGNGFATIDPYLHEWDEQYHALVAKNLSHDPFNPKLIVHSPVKLGHEMWIYNEIWLHKQPLFLWQMAVSIKIFGANLWAVRFPSVLLHALTALIVYSLGKRFLSRGLAVLACVLFGCSGYFNDFTSGAIGMDHNDVAFVFYVTASFLAWFKYRESENKNKWILLIGLFSGAAILCKWLVGLVVFSGWGMVLIAENWKNLKNWLDLLKAFGVTILFVIPWQLYCYVKYPAEYVYEMTFNSRHFTQVIENHGGNWLFYWDGMKDSFGSGELIRWILVLGLILFAYKAIKNRGGWLFAVAVFLVTYVFFTLAATKLQGYVSIVAAFGFIFMLYPFERLFSYLKSKKQLNLNAIAGTLLVLVVLFFQFSPKGVVGRHKYKAPDYRETRTSELRYALNILNDEPHFEGYFLLKGDKTNILTSLLFITGRKILYWNPSLEKTPGNVQNYRMIDLNKRVNQ